MSVIMMLVGALSTAVFHVDRYGVKLLPKVEPGLPKFKMLDFSVLSEHPAQIITLSLTVALVIVSSTLLTACNYAIKMITKYKITEKFLHILSLISVPHLTDAVRLTVVYQERVLQSSLALNHR